MEYLEKVFFYQTFTSLTIEDCNNETKIFYEIGRNSIEICSILDNYKIDKSKLDDSKLNDFSNIFWHKRLLIPEIVKMIGLKRLEISKIKIVNTNIACNLDLTFFKNLKDFELLNSKIKGKILHTFPKKKINIYSFSNKQVLNYQLIIFLKKKIKNFVINQSDFDEEEIKEIKDSLSNKTKLVVET